MKIRIKFLTSLVERKIREDNKEALTEDNRRSVEKSGRTETEQEEFDLNQTVDKFYGVLWWYIKSFIITGIVFGGSFSVGYFLADSGLITDRFPSWTSMIPIYIIASAVLGRLGWTIQTWEGKTLPERIDRLIFRFLYNLGLVILALLQGINYYVK